MSLERNCIGQGIWLNGCRMETSSIWEEWIVKLRSVDLESSLVKWKKFVDDRGIEDGVVVVKEKHDDKHLAAYYLGHATYSVEELRKKLKAFLPEYMIPTYFVKLDHMPMNANGKINRKALPEPNYEVSTRYEAPQNELQEKLVTIWSGVLKRRLSESMTISSKSVDIP